MRCFFRIAAAYRLRRNLASGSNGSRYVPPIRFSSRNLIRSSCGCTDSKAAAADRSLLLNWQAAGHSRELILLAAEYAKSHPSPMAAADRILSDWQRAGIRDAEGARREHEAHRSAAVRPGTPAQAGGGKDYLHRSYTQEDFRSMEVNLDEEEN